MAIYLDKILHSQTLHYTHAKISNHENLNKLQLRHWAAQGSIGNQPHLIVQSNTLPVLEVTAICARRSWTFSRSHGENLEHKEDLLSTESTSRSNMLHSSSTTAQ